jgi:formyl-CoA transferase
VRTPPPELGEHTDDVLHGLGYDDAAIAAYRRDGVVA